MWWLIVLAALAIGLALVAHRLGRSRRARPRRAKAPRRAEVASAPVSLLSSLPALDDDDLTLVMSSAQLRASLAADPTPLAASPPAATASSQRPSSSSLGVSVIAGHEQSRVILIRGEETAEEEPAEGAPRILVSAQGDSDQGRRRARNEDSFLVLEEHALFAVADGMGGHSGGQVASSLAMETIRSVFCGADAGGTFAADSPLPRPAQELAMAVLRANRAVLDRARSDPGLAEMGTTLVAARFALDRQRLYIGHVGDSRCYRLRDAQLDLLTTDHTMRELGLLGPRANDLSRAVGLEQNLDIDLIVDRPRAHDVYLLCTDGLTKMTSDAQILDVLLAEPDLESAVYSLIERANDAGGRDNVTVLLVKVEEAPTRPARRVATPTRAQLA